MIDEKCEICGSTDSVTAVYVNPSEDFPRIFSSCVCETCKKKYYRPHMRHFSATETVAENMVREYNERICI